MVLLYTAKGAMVSGFPKWGWFVEENNLGKMAKNCMKIKKSTFLGKNSGRHGDKPIFQLVGGEIPPPSFPTRRNLGIKGAISLRVLLPHSLSNLVGYENEISRKEIDSVDLTSLS